ncbi:hypothetical protein [uncultured Microbulbifer sp.]|uniref:hypothetical protein n=1 Tax=uncultured Microbulbifer sp. TaxID=348147 RepID=UPI002624D205|nr:hypothetical protein [uncultured Microbulbifer sp.]
MNEIQQLVSTGLENYIKDGRLKEAINKKLEKTIESVLDSALREYSDFGKVLAENIKEQLSVSASQISLPEYNKYISDMVGELYTSVLHEQANDHLKPLIEKALTPVPKEISASQLLEEIESSWKEEEWAYDEIKLDWKESEHAIYLTLNHPEHSWESVRISLFKDEGENGYRICYLNQDGKTYRRGPQAHTHNYGLIGYLFKLYCRETLITGIEEIYGHSIDLDIDH